TTTASGHSIANNFEVRYEPTSSSDVKGSSLRLKAITADGTNTDFTSFLQGLRFSLVHRNNGTIAQLIGGRFQMGMPTGTWGGSGTTGIINSMKGIDMELYSMKGTTNYATGISLESIGSNFTNLTYLRINQLTDVVGNFGIYNNSSYDNYFAGNVGIGTSAPDTTLHIVGNIKMEDGNEAAGRVLTSDANGVMTWTDPASISNASTFATTTGVTSNENGNYATDDFVFGSPQLDDDGISSHDRRMFFDKSKGAFRVGRVTGTHWDVASMGSGSVAFGDNTKATGETSTAMGSTTRATGSSSTAMGNYTAAIGSSSTAMGFGTNATGNYSTAMGTSTTATGNNSTAMGLNTAAESFNETAIGRFNTDYTPNSTTGWDAADRLFVIGNGTGSGATSNALTIYKDGKMNINDAYDMPTADGTSGQVLTTDGIGAASWQAASIPSIFELYGDTVRLDTSVVDITAANFVFGSPQLDYDGNSAHDSRMFFDKGKSAFRVGSANGTNWDTDSLGENSVAFGNDTKATGAVSMAIGDHTVATGVVSTSMGILTKATGDFSTAMGEGAEATGQTSTAMGSYTQATGDYSTAMGSYTQAGSYLETSIGMWNTDYTPNNTTGWDVADRLFVIGNGTGGGATSNALTIFKDGKMNINDAYDMPTADGSSGQVLTTDGSGAASWQAADTGSDDQTLSISGDTLFIQDGNSIIIPTDTLNLIADADNDTKIQVEENADEDIIRFDMAGTEFFRMDNGRLEVVNTGNSVFIGNGAGANDDFSDNGNVAVGDFALHKNTDGRDNTANGRYSLYSNKHGRHNTASGHAALYFNTNGYWNTANGREALYNNTTGDYNTANGSKSLHSNTTADYNVANGFQALFSNNGANNTANGAYSLENNTTGNDNSANGAYSLQNNTTGRLNTALGYSADVSTGDLRNATAIGANATVSQDSSVVLGNAANVGIGTSAPAAKLHVVGDVKIEDGTQSDGYVLTSDANGLASWQASVTDTLTIISDADNDTKIQVEESADEDKIRFDIAGNEAVLIENDNLTLKNSVLGNTPQLNFYTYAVSNSITNTIPVAYQSASNTSMNFEVDGNTSLKIFGNGKLKINNSYFLPAADGTVGQVLNTDGTGILSWSTPTLSLSSGLLSISGGNSVDLSSGFIETATPDGGSGGQNASIDVQGKVEAQNITANSSLKVGSSGTSINSIIKFSEERNVGSISGNNGITETFTVSGAQVGAVVYVSPRANLGGQIVVAQAWVSATNVVSVRLRNTDGGSQNPSNMFYDIVVIN
ncbi:MAG: hypothetical protein GY746_07740, partial [Gammaproteobacteria bacterium]|nr:hypothetical protein [Gammaproteobacteria bacterium]